MKLPRFLIVKIYAPATVTRPKLSRPIAWTAELPSAAQAVFQSSSNGGHPAMPYRLEPNTYSTLAIDLELVDTAKWQMPLSGLSADGCVMARDPAPERDAGEALVAA